MCHPRLLFRNGSVRIAACLVLVAAWIVGCAPASVYEPRKNAEFLADLRGAPIRAETEQPTFKLKPPDVSSATRPAMRMFDAFSDGREFNIADAYLCELACFVADSSDSTDVRDTFEYWGFEEATPFFSRQAGAYAWVFSGPKIVLVVFCNTDFGSSRDWSSNLDADLVKGDPELGPGELVHAGFLDAVQKLNFSSLKACIRASAARPAGGAAKSVWLTGHSRGGAMAVITAAALLHSDPSFLLSGIYTFGQPAVGNEVLAKRLKKEIPNYHRLINQRDPVPTIFGEPPWSKFVHAGTLHHLDGKFAQQIPAGEDWWMGDVVDHLHPSYMASIYRSLKLEQESKTPKTTDWAAPNPGSIKRVAR